MAEQLIKRKVYDKDNNLIRSGLVPKNIANERDALLAYWEREDAKQAEAEAAAAEAAAAQLEADQEPAVGDVVAPLEERLASAEAELEVLRGLKQATPNAVLEGVHQIARAAGAGALVEAAGKTAIATVDATVAKAQAVLKGVEGTVNETASAVGQLLADGRSQLERTQAEMVAKTTSSINKRIAKFELDVARMRGPKGSKGEWGSGTSYGKGKPPEKHPSGREWAVGEGYVNYAQAELPLYVRLADGWDKPVPTRMGDRLIHAQQNVLDQAPRVTTSQTIAQTGGGAGGGGERLLANAASRSTSVTIGDSSNWAPTNQDPTSGMLLLEVTAVDGTLASRRGYASVSFTYDAAGSNVTEFALLGDLADVYRFDITVSRSGAVLPAGLTGVSIPSGKSRTKVDLRIEPNNPASTGGVNNFLLSGVLLWTLKGSGRPLGAGQPGAEVPGWSWQ